MSRRGPRYETKGIHEVNLTALIDVSLVLVVILMVATPLALQSSIGLESAKKDHAAAKPADQQRPPAPIELTVLSADSVRVEGVLVGREGLPGALAPLLKAGPERPVVVRCADRVPHGVFVEVLDDAKMLGASRIAVVGS